jgi:hypothetical protein
LAKNFKIEKKLAKKIWKNFKKIGEKNLENSAAEKEILAILKNFCAAEKIIFVENFDENSPQILAEKFGKIFNKKFRATKNAEKSQSRRGNSRIEKIDI